MISIEINIRDLEMYQLLVIMRVSSHIPGEILVRFVF